MGRRKKKAGYNPEQIQQELMELAVKLYKFGNMADDSKDAKGLSLRSVAEELDMSVSKVVKLLITAGVYTTDTSEQIRELYEAGKSIADIQNELGISRAAVHYYLPYRKGVYNARETSLNTDRIRLYRERCKCVEILQADLNEAGLWNAIVIFQDYPFYTASGLKFEYKLKTGRDGSCNRELVVSRRKESKTLAWSSVLLAFNKALKMQGQVIDRPKALGDIRGISYIYPMLYRFGIIEVPEKTAEKMQLKGGNSNRKPKSL